ncbi:glycerophosphodiester phosphodiesterase [Ammoniphilus sp. CFH 90114]|uniref:glycerophosphodiester phosphodiesterase n=1 Tax=Ammoniphilus sp. CFH 90114 TaxID=2493665 RepID=UPI00100EE7DF|nr:glycerophosphodiester phosphodiesterase [Ammoniphilus sp. CFH 90114]RXT14919.1 glycerophosphodiester phosphodiesterase [Ammoniphilus sp. CFH 90114]
MNLSPKIFAHRGASHIYPENTMPAFKEAIRRGAHGLELDVQLSKDGHPVVIHDESLNRTTNGTGLVKHSTLKELKELSAGAWFHPRYSHLRIPTLDEVLLRARTSPILLNIEMKNLLIRSENLEEAIIQLVLKYDLLDRVILSSFNPQSIERAKQLHRQITTGFLYFGRLEEPWKMARELGAEYIHPPINIITTEYVHQCWLHGLQVCPYGANLPDDISLAFQCRVDGIITMYPEKARNYVE